MTAGRHASRAAAHRPEPARSVSASTGSPCRGSPATRSPRHCSPTAVAWWAAASSTTGRAASLPPAPRSRARWSTSSARRAASRTGSRPRCRCTEGLVAESQNRWPSLRFDVLAVNDLLSRFLPAGFYYKTFMSPAWAWERLFEPLIRRAAGLGRLAAVVGEHADSGRDRPRSRRRARGRRRRRRTCRRVHARARAACACCWPIRTRCSAAARCWMSAGPRGAQPRLAALARLPARAHPACAPCVLGAYGHGVFGALETLEPAEAQRCGGLRERLRMIRARRVLLACGAIERLIAFPGNDRARRHARRRRARLPAPLRRARRAAPGVVRQQRRGLRGGVRARSRGHRLAGVVDARAESQAADRALAARHPGLHRLRGRGGRGAGAA